MKNRIDFLAVLAFFTLISFAQAQDNLLSPEDWTVGTGSVAGYAIYGSSSENLRALGTNPFGDQEVLWVADPSGDAGPDGGFYSPDVTIDPTKTYRFTVWLKKTGSDTGRSYLGLYTRNASLTNVTANLDGTFNSNPYFWHGDLPQLDKWYLLIGYLHPNSYTGTSQGKMYDGTTFQEIPNLTFNDYKFGTGAITMRLRSVLFGDTSDTNFQYYWRPTIHEVDLSNQALEDQKIQELLGQNQNNSSSAIRINAGGPTVTYDGKQFDADQYFVGGTPYANTAAQIAELYQTERSGTAKTFDYNIPLSNGDYDITLHFADIYWGATGGGAGGVGKRIFDVNIEGNPVLDDYDIYAEVGGETPSIKNYTVSVSDGELNLNFSSLTAVGGVDQVKLSAIEVVPAGSSTGTTGGHWVKTGSDLHYTTGNVGIGTLAIPNYKLAVDGNIRAREVKVDSETWADYVFSSDYKLPTLKEVEKHIQEKGHLINIPSAQEVKANGVELGAMSKLLLEKIEELTLYTIQHEKRIKILENQK